MLTSMFNRQYITKNWTFLGCLSAAASVWIVVIILLAAFGSGMQWFGVFVSLMLLSFLYVGIVVWANNRRLSRRKVALDMFIERHALSRPNELEARNFVQTLGAIDQLHDARDQKIVALVRGDDWEYADFHYNLYGQLRGGEYVRARVYYGIMSTALPRRLPNVFFDSKRARRRQFRFHFSKSQIHSLEGDFDKFFVTYFPEGYTIDSMSFISPDVMWAMRRAADYDIEIYGDRLFLYGPLYDVEKQIPDMAAKIAPIKKELLDNILTYRDDRLPFAEGRQRVTGAAASLKLSKFWSIVTVIILALAVLLRIAAVAFDS
jgi:hypothetical protein